ncbi:TonB-dependent receptor plug domain-containing protein [Pleionea litopenaei]|uniref:TonB-dependent receptor n=1 Tax=Pleionea litopenaei TaxID=3070815 RepID=A0AA51RRE5_9GAMM|nr:TonB-dependent receptor [Pleionea sp. HL-JVS1]WMS86129.1 TonB-dependent receptor [Pleionea sp. HL-JVS1]
MKRNVLANAVKFAIVLSSATSLLSAPVFAAEDEGAEEKKNKITVTGSRIKRSEVEGASPVIVISREDMAAKGHVTVFDALRNLPQNNGFQFEGPESQLFTPDVQTLNLRGFGVGNTLVLVNGRRVANYPAAYQSNASVFNYGSIPAAAIERLEVLTTGASAIYGSDAVAGVVNIILRNDVDETTLTAIYGRPQESSSGQTQIQFVTGSTFDKGNITAAVEFQKFDALKAGDFDDYDSDLDFPYGQGVLLRDIINSNYWEFYWGRDRYVDPLANGVDRCETLNNGSERAFRPDFGWFCGSDGAADTNLRNKKDSISFMLDGIYEVSNDLKLFSNLMYYQSESASGNRYLTISQDILDTDTIVPTPFSFGDYYDWYIAQRRFSATELQRDLDQTFDDKAITFSVGLQGNIGFHDWEAVVNYSAYESTQKNPWWKAESVIDVFLGDYNGIGFFGDNWWEGNGTFGLDTDALFRPLDDNSRALINDAIGIQEYSNETSSLSFQATLTGELGEMDAGAIGYAAVIEHERQELEYKPDERLTQAPPADYLVGSGWWGLTGYTGIGDRDRSAAGIEVSFPLHETFTLNVAGRLDRYDSFSSDIGTRFTPQLTFEWRPQDSVLVRGGYGGSYRAPDMAITYVRSGSFTGATDLVQCFQNEVALGNNPDINNFDTSICDAQSVFTQRVGPQDVGATPLKDETGNTISLGLSVDISETTQLIVDWNRVELEDRIVTESPRLILEEEFECYRAQINDGPNYDPSQSVGRYTCNEIDARVDRGFDNNTGISYLTRLNRTPYNSAKEILTSIDARLLNSWQTEAGNFNFDIVYSNMNKHFYKSTNESDYLDLRNDIYNGGWDFRSSVSATFGYRNDGLSTAITAFRRGSTGVYRPPADLEGDNGRVGPYITWNYTLGYNWSNDFSTRLRVRNVFDQKPPSDSTFLFYDHPWYNPYTYSGAGIGREFFIEANYTF